jgi:hypothetical protein
MIFDDVSSKTAVSNSGLTVTQTTSSLRGVTQSSVGFSSGKKYWEIQITGAVGGNYAVAGAGAGLSSVTSLYPGDSSTSFGYHGMDGGIWVGGSIIRTCSTFTVGDIIGIAVDADTGKFWVSKNGVWQASGDPSAGTNPAGTISFGGTIKPAVSLYSLDQSIIARFADKNRAYPIPAGFSMVDLNAEASYSTWDINDWPARLSLSNAGRTITRTTSVNYVQVAVECSRTVSSGKWYFEVYIDSYEYNMIVGLGSAKCNTYPGTVELGIGIYLGNGNTYPLGTNQFSGCTTGDTIGVAYDADTKKIFFSKNGVWGGSSNPVTGVNPAYTNTNNYIYHPFVSLYVSPSSATSRFYAEELAYPIPSGYFPIGNPLVATDGSIVGSGGAVFSGSSLVNCSIGLPNGAIVGSGGAVFSGATYFSIDCRDMEVVYRDLLKQSLLLTHGTIYGELLYEGWVDINPKSVNIDQWGNHVYYLLDIPFKSTPSIDKANTAYLDNTPITTYHRYAGPGLLGGEVSIWEPGIILLTRI